MTDTLTDRLLEAADDTAVIDLVAAAAVKIGVKPGRYLEIVADAKATLREMHAGRLTEADARVFLDRIPRLLKGAVG
jgi:hypothetical protein